MAARWRIKDENTKWFESEIDSKHLGGRVGIGKAKELMWEAYRKGVRTERKKRLYEMHKIRPYADCYRRVCENLGIPGNILGYIEKLRRDRSCPLSKQ